MGVEAKGPPIIFGRSDHISEQHAKFGEIGKELRTYSFENRFVNKHRDRRKQELSSS